MRCQLQHKQRQVNVLLAPARIGSLLSRVAWGQMKLHAVSVVLVSVIHHLITGISVRSVPIGIMNLVVRMTLTFAICVWIKSASR